MIPLGKIEDLTPIPWIDVLLNDPKLRGPAGKDGMDGINGKQGLVGERGERGNDGRDGVDGRDGLPGRDGVDGFNGRDGSDGLNGIDGKDGEQGLQGLPGKQGKRGPKGDKGEQGNPPKHQIDRANHRIRFEQANGSWGAWLEFIEKHEHKVMASGGGGQKLTNAIQDISHLKFGKFADYSRITTTTADLTLTDFHRIVVAKTNAVTITLPPAATYYNSDGDTGIVYSIVNDSANTNDVTLAADGSELIDSANTWTVPPGASPKIITDGTKWHIF